jgi:hypothetical protein
MIFASNVSEMSLSLRRWPPDDEEGIVSAFVAVLDLWPQPPTKWSCFNLETDDKDSKKPN